MLRICSIATVVLCVARSAVADTYAPSYCEFSISPSVTAERRLVHGEFGNSEVAEYFTKETFLKAQCSKLLERPFSKAEIAKYLEHVLKSSGVSSDGSWRTYNTTGGTAVSLKGTAVQLVAKDGHRSPLIHRRFSRNTSRGTATASIWN